MSIHMGRSYNPAFAVLHEDYEDDAFLVEGPEFQNDKIQLRVLNPVDLAVSKITRYEGPDKEDIAALAQHKLIYPKAVAESAEEALSYYVGNIDRVRFNLKDALHVIEEVQKNRKRGSKGLENGR